VSDEKLWDESPTSRHLQVLYHQTSFQMLSKRLQDVSCIVCFGRSIYYKLK